MHEQELFKLAAKSDASADLEQVLTTFISIIQANEEKFVNAQRKLKVASSQLSYCCGHMIANKL